MLLDVSTWQAAGAHYGYSRSRRHPSALPFLYGVRNRTDIINLESTNTQLEAAVAFLKDVVAKNGQIIFVGSKPEARAALIKAAQSLDAHYVDQRWIGGAVTNFSEIKKRIDTLNDLSDKRENDKLVYKTKKERLLIERKITKLEKMFGGIRNLDKTPSALVVIDPRKEHIAVSEATVKSIPIVALANTDCDMEAVTYPVCANDASNGTIALFLETLTAAVKATN